MVSRRLLCSIGALGAATALGGCNASMLTLPFMLPTTTDKSAGVDDRLISRPDYSAVYADYSGEPFPIPAFDHRSVDAAYLRQEVEYRGPGRAGEIVVNPATRQLYFVQAGGRATRYGVGVGKEGFGWTGEAQINMRRAWPDWVPPEEMVARDPSVRAQLVSTERGLGVPGGPRSPLGARAMYLFAATGDTGYRIHGTTEPETIGSDVSSGCIRMVNQDVIHLYGRTSISAKVHVLV